MVIHPLPPFMHLLSKVAAARFPLFGRAALGHHTLDVVAAAADAMARGQRPQTEAQDMVARGELFGMVYHAAPHRDVVPPELHGIEVHRVSLLQMAFPDIAEGLKHQLHVATRGRAGMLDLALQVGERHLVATQRAGIILTIVATALDVAFCEIILNSHNVINVF